jgi:hypothetical protein
MPTGFFDPVHSVSWTHRVPRTYSRKFGLALHELVAKNKSTLSWLQAVGVARGSCKTSVQKSCPHLVEFLPWSILHGTFFSTKSKSYSPQSFGRPPGSPGSSGWHWTSWGPSLLRHRSPLCPECRSPALHNAVRSSKRSEVQWSKVFGKSWFPSSKRRVVFLFRSLWLQIATLRRVDSGSFGTRLIIFWRNENLVQNQLFGGRSQNSLFGICKQTFKISEKGDAVECGVWSSGHARDGERVWEGALAGSRSGQSCLWRVITL